MVYLWSKGTKSKPECKIHFDNLLSWAALFRCELRGPYGRRDSRPDRRSLTPGAHKLQSFGGSLGPAWAGLLPAAEASALSPREREGERPCVPPALLWS